MTVWAWLCLLVGFSVLWQPPVLWLPLLCSLFVPELWTISMKCSLCVTPAFCALNQHLTQPHLTCKEVPIIGYAPCSVQLVLKLCFTIKRYIGISGLEMIQRPTNANSHMDFCLNSHDQIMFCTVDLRLGCLQAGVKFVWRISNFIDQKTKSKT